MTCSTRDFWCKDRTVTMSTTVENTTPSDICVPDHASVVVIVRVRCYSTNPSTSPNQDRHSSLQPPVSILSKPSLHRALPPTCALPKCLSSLHSTIMLSAPTSPNTYLSVIVWANSSYGSATAASDGPHAGRQLEA